jgi:hypothetical protein
MDDFSIVRELLETRVSYRLEGVFNGKAVFELKQAIASEPPGHLELDFSHVSKFFDFGLAAFATELPTVTRPGLTVDLHGLSLHHRRLLHYFGLELPRLAELFDDLTEAPSPMGDRASVR